jgi:RNA polymerase sigma factor (sigma-70 family)
VADAPLAIDYDGLYRQCADSVYRICRAVLGSHEAAEDALQDVFRKLLSNPPKQNLENLRGWLHTTARTTAIDHLRAMRNHAPPDDDEPDEPPSDEPTLEEIVLTEELRQLVRRHLDVLTPNQRRVVELRSEGLRSKEIAELLDRNVGWVDQNYHRALERLRTSMGADFPKQGGAQ